MLDVRRSRLPVGARAAAVLVDACGVFASGAAAQDSDATPGTVPAPGSATAPAPARACVTRCRGKASAAPAPAAAKEGDQQLAPVQITGSRADDARDGATRRPRRST